ncbi:MAG: hypothetical protein FWC56_03520, partial [Phycisphaerae bacterium]|nr:hypothetical protein [Phycisphaerae bacterium]
MANEEPKMTPETFEREIKKGLQNLDRWQRVRFAWLCGVRALPFLGAKGHFEYWNSKKKGDLRQKHLLAVFRALDVAAAYAYDAAYAAA